MGVDFIRQVISTKLARFPPHMHTDCTNSSDHERPTLCITFSVSTLDSAFDSPLAENSTCSLGFILVASIELNSLPYASSSVLGSYRE